MRHERVLVVGGTAMQNLQFNSNTRPTLGVELEFGLVDAHTMELSSSINRVLDRLSASASVFKPELSRE